MSSRNPYGWRDWLVMGLLAVAATAWAGAIVAGMMFR